MITRGTRPLVESALLSALSAVLMLLAWYVPVVGMFAGLVSPLPVAVAVMRHGTRWGVMSSLVTMFVMTPFVGIATALALWAIYGAMGLSFGVAVRHNLRPTTVLAAAAAGSALSLVVQYSATYLLMGLTLSKQFDEIWTILREAFEQTKQILGPNPAIDELLKNLPTVDAMMAMIPALLILAAFLLAYVNFEIFRRILPRLGYSLEPLPPFSRWIFPEFLALAGLVAFLALNLRAYVSIPGLSVVAQNVFAAASIFFLVEAISVMMFYLLRSGMSRGVAGLFAFLAVSMMFGDPTLSLLVTLFGMIDILFDFRRIRFTPLGEI